MKKILLTLSVFVLLILSTSVFAQTSTNINIDTRDLGEAYAYVPNISIDKTQYSIGEKITGKFSIDNNSNIRQSDIYFTSAIIFETENGLIEVDTKKDSQNIYLEPKSRLVVNFEHTVTNNFNGKPKIMIRVHESSGAIIGAKSINFQITGGEQQEFVRLYGQVLSVNGNIFQLQVGPTVKKDDSLKINFKTQDLESEYKVTPIITLYNRTYDTSKIKEIKLNEITLQSNKEYSFDLPTDLDPMVYAGVLSFEVQDVFVESIYFRYIIEGSIGTILNANTDKLSGGEGDTINVSVYYAGTPFDITSEEVKTIDETAEVEVVLFDENNVEIGRGKETVSLNDVGSASIPVSLNKKADRFSVNVSMTSGDKILSSYNVELPTEEELQNAYGTSSTKDATNLRPLAFLFLALLVMIVIYLLVLKKVIKKIPTVVVALIIVCGIYGINTVSALVLFSNGLYTASSYNFGVSAMISPGPSDSVSYSPGEEFTLQMIATFISCDNGPHLYSLFGPADDWTNGVWSPDRFLEGFSALNILGNWQQRDAEIKKVKDWWLITKGGFNLFESDEIGTHLGNFNADAVSRFDIIGNRTYRMPQQPGKHNFYFILFNTGQGQVSTYKIYYQEVCVRGAGICLDENLVCPNLPGNYTKEGDTILLDGVAQSLWQDPTTGNCLSTPIVTARAEGVTSTTAPINWTYFDLKAHKHHKLELFTDSALTVTSKVKEITNIVAMNGLDEEQGMFAKFFGRMKSFVLNSVFAQVSEEYTDTFTGLIANTNYWVKISASNIDDVWSEPVVANFTTLSGNPEETTFSPTCSANPDPVNKGANVTFTVTPTGATGNVTYVWVGGGALSSKDYIVPSDSGTPFTKSVIVTDTKNTPETDDDEPKELSCSVNVNSGTSNPSGECAAQLTTPQSFEPEGLAACAVGNKVTNVVSNTSDLWKWKCLASGGYSDVCQAPRAPSSGDVPDVEFEISPSVEPKCQLIIRSNDFGQGSCSLFRRGQTLVTFDNLQQIEDYLSHSSNVDSGTYVFECYDTDGSTIYTQSDNCISNPSTIQD